MGLPADASGAYRPNPQATTKLSPRPSSLKSYIIKFFATRKKSSAMITQKRSILGTLKFRRRFSPEEKWPR